jgi:hypothetical protein
MAVTNVQNTTAQSNAYPSRWSLQPRSPAAGNTTLTLDAAKVLVTYDCIVNYRGGPIVQGVGASLSVAPAFGLILIVGLQVSVASTLMITVDQGDGNFVNAFNPAVTVPVSPPIFTFTMGLPPLFYCRINLTRTPSTSTTVVWHANIVDSQ